MGMAGDGKDAAREVGGITRESFADLARLTPGLEYSVYAVRKDGGREVSQ